MPSDQNQDTAMSLSEIGLDSSVVEVRDINGIVDNGWKCSSYVGIFTNMSQYSIFAVFFDGQIKLRAQNRSEVLGHKVYCNIVYTKNTDTAINQYYYQDLYAGKVYSTDEIRVGTWVDGKPIYRKVFNGLSVSIPANTSWVKLLTIANGDTIVRGIVYGANIYNKYYTLQYTISLENGDVYVRGTGVADTCKRLTIEYTKTTD